MEATRDLSFTKEFARSAQWRREQDQLLFEKHRKQQQEKQFDRSKDDEADFGAMAVMASSEEIATFEITLDKYDTAVIAALDENEHDLTAVHATIQDKLEKAFVLPDGRRAFKTEDGMRVFDEHGSEIAPDELSADEIEDWRPRWEAFSADKQAEQALTEERQDLMDYQHRIDDAREKLDDPISKQELVDLKRDLEADMPQSVRKQLGMETNQPAPASTAFNAVAPQPVQFAAKPQAPEFVQ
ncbi:MAG: hypothetical protein KKC03_13490 [Bacteroidetes bacterium]|nr:hypothetical protein [Bacteroidota bacterium]